MLLPLVGSIRGLSVWAAAAAILGVPRPFLPTPSRKTTTRSVEIENSLNLGCWSLKKSPHPVVGKGSRRQKCFPSMLGNVFYALESFPSALGKYFLVQEILLSILGNMIWAVKMFPSMLGNDFEAKE